MRVSGLGGTPNELARSIVIWLPLGVVFGFMKTTKRCLRIIALGSVATGAAALCLTASRGGMLTAALTALAGLAIYAFSRSLRARVGLLWGRAVFATLFLVVVVLAGTQGLVSRLVNDDHGQAASRWTMIQVATALIADNPIGGVGLNSYVLEMNRYDNSDFKVTEIFYYPVHNLYLLLAGELGGAGLILYVMIFIALLSYATKALGSLRIQHAAFGFSILLALIAFALYGLIEGDTLGSRAFMHFWVAGACAAALRTPAIGRKRNVALATSMPTPSRHPDMYHSLP
jgi:O-antigen ligase